MARDIEEIKTNLKERFIVCPMPTHWEEIHKILKEHNNQNINIKNPLILGGWGCSDKEKFERFIHHISVAQDLGILSKVLNYIDSLDDEDFLDSDELKSGKDFNEKGYYNIVAEDTEEVHKKIAPALTILEKIQGIDRDITDESLLFDLFNKNGFNSFIKPKLTRGESLLVDFLSELYDIFDSQKSLPEGSEYLDDFCFEIFHLKETK